MEQISPLQSLIDKLNSRIEDSVVTTKKLSEIIQMAVESRDGLIEAGNEIEHPHENDWWANKAIFDFTEIIVRANYKAQTILNPNIDMGDLQDQINGAFEDVKREITYSIDI